MQATNTKRVIAVYLGFLILIFFASFLMLFFYSHESPLQRCDSIQIPGARYSCMISLVNSTGNSSICSQLSGYYQYSCYSMLAAKTKSVELCKQISNISMQVACESEIAISTGNTSICGLEGAYSGSCYTKFANKTLNASLCYSAGNSTDTCLAIVYTKLALLTGKSAYCSEVPELTNKTEIGMVLGNVSMQQLENETTFFSGYLMMPNQTYSARDFCFFADAYLTRNNSICYFMAPSPLQSACLAQTSKIQTPSSTLNYTAQMSYCQSLGQYSALCQQAVTTAFAIKNKNATYCTNLQGSEENACYAYVAMAEKNASICNLITNSTLSGACKEAIALNASSYIT